MENGTLTLKASLDRNEYGEKGQRFRMELVDTARGVSKLQRGRIQRAFMVSDRIMTTSNAGSMGLGMALAKEILHLHGGELQVLPPNRGESIFAILLPTDISE